MESLKHNLQSGLPDQVVFGEEELHKFREIRSGKGDA
jgi:hypothetical protein